MRVALGADHGGFSLKEKLAERLRDAGYEVVDMGAFDDRPTDYPDFSLAVGLSVAEGSTERGLLVCGSGVGACIAANKVPRVRASTAQDTFSARQGVEDDDMNVLCMGARVIGLELAWEVARAFLEARFSEADRHRRRLQKVKDIEGRYSRTEGGEANG